MFTLSIFRRRNDRPTTRRPHARCRRPQVDGLEGRQLLAVGIIVLESAAIVGQHIGTNVVGQHIGSAIVGQHIGSAIVGQHIG